MIALAAERDEQFRVRGIVFDFLAEFRDMDVHRTGIHGFGVLVAPDLLEEFGAGNGVVAVVPQVFEDFDFLAGEREFFGAAGAGVFAEVHAEVAGDELAFVFHGLATAAQHGFDSGEEHRDGERLRHVVVGAVLEAVDDVFVGVLCRKDDDREALVLFTDLVTDGEAVHAREHEVKEDKSILAGQGLVEAAFTVGHVLHAVAVQFAKVHETFGDCNFVFDNENIRAARILCHF